MAIVVAFLNFKGGVGKTANVVNIGACLAATHQKRVLLIDLDARWSAPAERSCSSGPREAEVPLGSAMAGPSTMSAT